MLNNLTTPHEYPGKLLVVEGIDGSGKTTQLGLLAKWLAAEGHKVFVTEWNSSALVKAATKTGKKKNALTPMTFSFAVRPDVTLYFRVPIDVSLDRLMGRRVKLKFYDAGMDMGWSANPVESFRLFQGKVLDEYDRLVEEFGLNVVSAVGSITEQQRIVRDLVARHIRTTHVVEKAETPDEQLV